MADQEIKSKANIGSSSLILIFIVLCLVTFGLLSLSSAKSDWNLADKNAKAVRGYYDADNQGEAFIKMVDETLTQVFAESSDIELCKANLKKNLGDYYQEESGLIVTEIPMDFDQALHIELTMNCGDEPRYEVQTWKVINKVDYEIDDSMPVWGGQS